MLLSLVTLKLSELTGRGDINDENTDMLLIIRKTEHIIKETSKEPDVVLNIHSGVLRVASPYFMRTIDNLEVRRRNSQDSFDQLQYVIDTLYPYVIQRIIYYIYRNDHQNINEHVRHLVPFYQECMRLELTDLKNTALRMIRSQGSIDELVCLASAAESGGEIELANECGRILSDCAFVIFSGHLHLKIGITALKSLLQCDNIQLDEVQIFAALCYYLDNDPNLHSPYSSNHLGNVEKELIKSIRFCSMSADAISEFRCEAISTFLLDAALRILLKNQLKTRVHPWQENDEYKTLFYNSLYPVMLVRVGKYNLNNFDHNKSNVKLVTPQVVDGGDVESYLAFTYGTERESSEICWAYEVSRTKNGKLGLGVALRTDEPLDELSRNVYSSLGKTKKTVFYYEFHERKFKSGYIDNCCRDIRSPWTYDSSVDKDSYELKTRDIVLVKVHVTLNCINLEISILGENFTEKFPIPIKTNKYIGNILRRPSVNVSPFIVTYDIGDALCIPELRESVHV